MKIDEMEMDVIFKKINKSDIILKNGSEQFVSLKYDSTNWSAPAVVCKRNFDFNYCLTKIAEKIGIPCVENKLLTKALFDETHEWYCISDKYYMSVSKIYQTLKCRGLWKPINDDNFFDRLRKNSNYQICYTEIRLLKRAIRKYLKSFNDCVNTDTDDVIEKFKQELYDLSKNNNLIYRISSQPDLGTEEINLDFFLEEYNITFWQIIFISQKERKIYIGTRAFIKAFEFSESKKALGLIKTITGTICKEIKRDAILYQKEFDINVKIYDIVQNSLPVMLEENYMKTGIEYGFLSDTTAITFYLSHKSSDTTHPQRMHEIVITYKEFMRDPTAFKNFIAAPHKKYKWNFWCHERVYKKERLDEKFKQEEKE